MDKLAKIEISWKTIVFTVFFLLLLNFIWIIRDIVFSLFIAFIIMSALKPYVSFLERRKIPRIIATTFIYLVFVVGLFYTLFLILPPLIGESTLLFRDLPAIIQRANPKLTGYVNFQAISQFVPNIANQFFDIIKSLLSNAFFLITTLFFGFYFLLEENVIKKLLATFFEPEENQVTKTLEIFSRAEKRLNSWFWGEITLMTAVGLMTFIGLNLINMKFALALAVLAGLLEIVPNIGPILSAVPAILIGFSHSYLLGVSNLALYFIVQQIENNLIVPIVMKKVVGLNPIITLLALLIGGRIGGITGALLAIPITLFLETFLIVVAASRLPKTAVNSR